ncbi:N-acetylmuramic acid 6-phosphate etherase [Streptomyces shenzhenensis]|uniref:N-acetylmuramic acid 6-phosphate etherase n=1 Tax=Streptomyces shenzhenensis TaxID=943815 RepID=A0A3M0ISD2_9ACTN|nr:N-acetylmuramic acid 6-phosphate etherase [Streptomyces shenzhenensis]RMB85026.1 N-acetylmuramic acid 6-phosphate etherase [Streptomyces shenzhenensis]
MTRTPPPNASLDALVTERMDGIGPMLDALPTTDLVRLMNDGDAAVAGAVRQQTSALAAAVDAVAARMASGGRLIYAGAGTSGRLGILDASEIPPTFGAPPGQVVGLIAGGPRAVTDAVEAAEDNPELGRADVDALDVGALDTVVGIASSGRTPYVLGAVRRAAELGCLTVGLSCNVGAPLSAAVDIPLEVVVGEEIVRGSTRLRAGTATKMVLNTLSTLVMVRLGKTYGSLMVDVQATNDKLRQRAVRIVTTATGADERTARRVLEAAGWHAKTAIAMVALDCDRDTARAALAAASDRLGSVMEGH